MVIIIWPHSALQPALQLAHRNMLGVDRITSYLVRNVMSWLQRDLTCRVLTCGYWGCKIYTRYAQYAALNYFNGHIWPLEDKYLATSLQKYNRKNIDSKQKYMLISTQTDLLDKISLFVDRISKIYLCMWHVCATMRIHWTDRDAFLYIFFSIQACPDVKYGKRIHVLPIDESIEGLTGYVLRNVSLCFRSLKWRTLLILVIEFPQVSDVVYNMAVLFGCDKFCILATILRV